MDFDALDQTQYDPALRLKINSVQVFADGACKFLEPIDDQKQFALHRALLPGFKDLLVNLLKPIPQLLHLRLEVGLIEDAVRIAVDQPGLSLFQLQPLLF
ncbi:hypothetical protein D9M68_651080 [compost metagenome]